VVVAQGLSFLEYSMEESLRPCSLEQVPLMVSAQVANLTGEDHQTIIDKAICFADTCDEGFPYDFLVDSLTKPTSVETHPFVWKLIMPEHWLRISMRGYKKPTRGRDLYIVEFSDATTKIGRANCTAQRIKRVKSNSGRTPLRAIYFIGAGECEQLLLRHTKEHSLEGEFRSMTSKQVLAQFEKLFANNITMYERKDIVYQDS